MGQAFVRIDRPGRLTAEGLPSTTQPVKDQLSDLAHFGGAPAFAEALHVGRPLVRDRQRLFARFEDILDRCWLTNDGPYVQEFEQRVAKIVGVRHCVAMSSGTMALEIAARGLGLAGEVILPAMTFVATAHALRWQQIKPVFADIDSKSWNIDPDHVEQLITRRTTGIIGVHLWGRSCETGRLTQIARRRNLKLLFDASHSFGCSRDGRMIGSFGDAEVFSFHATKIVNSGEGGAVVTNNDQLAEKLRGMRNFGFAGRDVVGQLGTNGKMSELQAALGLTSLEDWQEAVRTNRRNYRLYRTGLAGIPGVRLMEFGEEQLANYQYVVVELDAERAGIDRDGIVRLLEAEGVLARRYFYPGCHRMQPYLSEANDDPAELPITDRLVQRVLSLPTGISVNECAIRAVCSIVRFIVDRGPEIQRRLSDRQTSTLTRPVLSPG